MALSKWIKPIVKETLLYEKHVGFARYNFMMIVLFPCFAQEEVLVGGPCVQTAPRAILATEYDVKFFEHAFRRLFGMLDLIEASSKAFPLVVNREHNHTGLQRPKLSAIHVNRCTVAVTIDGIMKCSNTCGATT